MDLTVKIGGEAGQGVQTVGESLSKVFSRTGLHVFTNQDYDSRIRGGHNFYQIRFSENEVMSPRDKVDIIVALDRESIKIHERELTENGLLLYDSAALKISRSDRRFLDIPFNRLATGNGSVIMANTVATGAVLGLLGMPPEGLFEIIKSAFSGKGDAVVQANVNASLSGYDYAVKNCPACSFSVRDAILQRPLKMLVSGIEAIGIGAVAAGCRFYAAYPMTPSTGIMNYLAGKSGGYGIVVEQAEDEISAINMALGASYAGVRSMSGTAGGGFALMVEGLSLAGMTETPVVVALGQRAAPATGLPTRTEQGDLDFALYAGHGEFPRVVFAPGTPEQAFYLTQKAFDLAERFQIPVIVMFDAYLADISGTCDDFGKRTISHADYRLRGDAFKALKEYKRHAFTETGISPMAVPGDSSFVVVTDSDEHDEEGHIAEDAETRTRMVEKRLLKKMPRITKEIGAPCLYVAKDRGASPDIVIAGWGSTFGVMKEAVDELSGTHNIAMLHFSEIWPFPAGDSSGYRELLNKARFAICVENNAGGQFARLVRSQTGFEFRARINRYDGRPFSLEQLTGEIRRITGGHDART